MRILLLGRARVDSFGGIQRVLIDLLDSLYDRGHGATYVQLSREDGTPAAELERTPEGWRVDACNGLTLKQILDRSGPDLVHSHNLHTPFPPTARQVERLTELRGIPHLLTVHDVTHHAIAHHNLCQLRTTMITTQSEYNRRRLQMCTGLDAMLLRVGIEFDRYMVSDGCEPRTVGYPGRLMPAKGAHRAIRIVGALSERRSGRIRLLLSNRQAHSFGQSPTYLQHLDTLAASFKNLHCEYLDQTHETDGTDTVRLYQRAAVILVMPVALEGFGLVPLESLASGRPVVALPTGGMRDWLMSLPGVHLLPSSRTEPGVAAIDAILREWRAWHEAALRAREILRPLYDRATIVAQHLALYEHLITRGPAPRPQNFEQ